ncbi:MAG: AAA family ATPase [Desulfobacterales bacterium]|nr:AAA family ATPase [Desulfobacterales bacterium]
MTRTWPRGSEWRKWDLHIHAPGTKLNDQFTAANGDVWDEYCWRLHNSDVQAFGITDYFSADGYFSAREKFRERYPDSSKVFFPNIELRTNDVVNKAQEEVNIHLVFNPFRPDHEDRIKSFLVSLKTNKTDGAGRNVRASELTQKSHFEEATTTRAFIREALEETYGKGAELLGCVLIVAAANNDGIRAERGKKRKHLITDEVDKFSDAFFGNAGNVKYFLSTDRAKDKTEHTEPKPVLSVCDAHSLSELDERLGQVISDSSSGIVLEPTWIKSDLTFEGLKQIIFEPRNRVFIGEEPEIDRRVREHKTRYIESLHITCIDGYQQDRHGAWFCDEQIVLGKELVAIIGNKGSGKSAVTDIIGLLGNSHNQTLKGMSGGKVEELFSFLNKDKFLKGGCAGHFQGALHWYKGEPDRKLLNAQVASHLPERVEYLPQKYLERICANIADDEFRATLNEVIFRYVKPQDQFGKTNLNDVIEYRTQQAEEDIAQKKQELHQANAKVVSVESKLTEDFRKELEEKIKLKKEDLEAHATATARPSEKQNPEATAGTASAETAQIEQLTQRIAGLADQIAQFEAKQVEVSRTAEELRQVRQAIEREVGTLTGLEAKYQTALSAAGLAFDQIIKLTVDYSTLDVVVSAKEQRLREIEALLLTKDQIAATVGGDDEAAAESARAAESLVCQKAALEAQKVDLVERLGKPAREYQEYLKDLKLWTDREKELRGDDQNPAADTLKGLKKELEKVNTVYPEALRNARADRERISKEVFNKKRGLTQFYNGVKQSIDTEIAKCREHLGEYDISIEAGLRFSSAFFDEFLKFINQGAVGSFRGQEEGRAMLRRLSDTVTDWENEGEVFKGLDAIVEALHTDKRDEVSPPNAARDVFKQMKGQRPVQELYDYLFGFDYLGTKYDLKVDQKDLSELSPGERGGLLLVFYLMLDRQDIPLVIDQPEDNLDNKSVYEILVTFIKQAKERRQIILVTHNPNLAVVADAEQIIHVSIDKKDGKHDFDFFSGSIEDARINRAVVDILEGTLPAFDNRRLKYRKQERRAVRGAPGA